MARKYIPGISHTKGGTAGRKFRPKAIETMGDAAHVATTTTGNISPAVARTALVARNWLE